MASSRDFWHGFGVAFTPPEALDALKSLGFNLLSLSNNHAFDLQATGIRNTIREADRRQIVTRASARHCKAAAQPI